MIGPPTGFSRANTGMIRRTIQTVVPQTQRVPNLMRIGHPACIYPLIESKNRVIDGGVEGIEMSNAASPFAETVGILRVDGSRSPCVIADARPDQCIKTRKLGRHV